MLDAIHETRAGVRRRHVKVLAGLAPQLGRAPEEADIEHARVLSSARVRLSAARRTKRTLTLLVCMKRDADTGYMWKPSRSAKSACGCPEPCGAPLRESRDGAVAASTSPKSIPFGRFTNREHRCGAKSPLPVLSTTARTRTGSANGILKIIWSSTPLDACSCDMRASQGLITRRASSGGATFTPHTCSRCM